MRAHWHFIDKQRLHTIGQAPSLSSIPGFIFTSLLMTANEPRWPVWYAHLKQCVICSAFSLFFKHHKRHTYHVYNQNHSEKLIGHDLKWNVTSNCVGFRSARLSHFVLCNAPAVSMIPKYVLQWGQSCTCTPLFQTQAVIYAECVFIVLQE